jgi:hypothetical protein
VIYVDYIRKLGHVDKEPQYLVPGRVQFVAPMSRRCLRRLSVKARRQQLKLERADRARGVVLLLANEVALEQMLTFSELISSPPFLVASGEPPAIPGEPHKGHRSPPSDIVYGIVPDGVASVALLSERNPELTVQVTSNFFAIEVPSSFHHGGATVVWRDAGGHTLNGRAEGSLR